MNLFASPLTTGEFLAATMILSVGKVLAVSCVTVLAALAFYSFNIFVLGVSLIPFILNLIIAGWCIGVLTTGLIMRYGQEVEVLAWGMVFLFQPISCVFYPMSVLPDWLQAIAQLNPAAHVFEGMRAVITDGAFPVNALASPPPARNFITPRWKGGGAIRHCGYASLLDFRRLFAFFYLRQIFSHPFESGIIEFGPVVLWHDIVREVLHHVDTGIDDGLNDVFADVGCCPLVCGIVHPLKSSGLHDQFRTNDT